MYCDADRTTLTIAHRLSSITHCDSIIVMDKGKVVEQGTHAELMQKDGGKGLYARMFVAQNGENVGSGAIMAVPDGSLELELRPMSALLSNRAFRDTDRSLEAVSGMSALLAQGLRVPATAVGR
jgi:ABC-type multidrug transport system ATPase subunit